jgi:hypothetical protein
MLRRLTNRNYLQKSPNSRASVDLWGHIFGSKEEEEADQNNESLQTTAEVVEDASYNAVSEAHHPVASPEIAQARQDFSREYWRDLVQGTRFLTSNHLQSFEIPPPSTNVQASGGDDYRYLPQ